MILMLKGKQMLLNIFMLIQFEHFHDSLNLVMILAPDCEFFYPKRTQFPLTFTK